jgi:hypothetical protein
MGIIADLCNFEEDVAEILSGEDVIKLFCPEFTSFHTKLECLSLSRLSSLV